MFSKVITVFYLKRSYIHTYNSHAHLCLFNHFSVQFSIFLCWGRFELLSLILLLLYGMNTNRNQEMDNIFVLYPVIKVFSY